MTELGSRSKHSSSDRNLLNSSNKKKRSRVDATDSEESSDNDSDNAYDVEKPEIESKKSVSNGLDVFEFDEYDNLDYTAIIKKNSNNSSSKDKCNLLYSKPSYADAKICRVENEMEDDDSDLPLTVLKKKYRLSSSDKPTRLNGKNAVLKVMHKKKKLDSDDGYEKEPEPIVVDKKNKLHSDTENEKEPEPVVVHKNKKVHRDAENEKETESIVVHKNKKVHRDAENEKEPESIVVHRKNKVHKDAENEKEPENIVVHKKNKLHSDDEDEKEPESTVVLKKKKLHNDVEGEKETEPIVMHKKNKLHCDSEDGLNSRSEDSNIKTKEEKKPILYSRTKRAGKKVTPVKDESSSKREVVKNEGVIKKVTPVKDESSSKQQVVKNEEVVKKVTPVKKKESKVKSGSGTQKQILREKIKCMLLDAGWTIDYRPRRGRNYMDSVYFSPAGTGYWSIVKAYDAFQKEEEENSKDGKDFTPLPVLDILTRQARKKRGKKRTESDDEDSEDDNKETSSLKNKRKNRKLGRSTLLVRGSDNGVSSENDGFVSYPGKRTILSWLIDSGVVEMSENVEYRNRKKTRAMQKGYITKDGIHCDCCSKIVTISKFEAHAGSKLRQPLLNIVLKKSGKSLMQCLNDAWDKQGELERKGFYKMDVLGDDPNDDTCGICGDGGDLICCDGCPSTFHQSCLEIQMLPQGDWHCPNCSCKFCKKACEKVDGEEEALLTCCFCQKKYHESCRPGIDVKPIESNYSNISFCGQKCNELYSNLQKLFGVKRELDSGFSWSLIHRSDISTDDSSVKHSQRVLWNCTLAVAMSVMDECFLPFTDRRSGTNLIRNVVFNCGSNVSRLNYSSFFTAILEKGDEVFCAASIRIHGTQLAEMPFIGTRHRYRRQGMCRRLLSAIESALASLQVEKLIIPAVAEHMNTWTDVFGFLSLEESHKQELKSLNMVVFPGTDMLQKPVAKQDIPNTVLQGSDTVEEDTQNALSEKPEITTSESKTDSGSEESSVPSDDGCSIDLNEIFSASSPVKNDDSPVGHKLSASVDSQIETNVDESIVQVANKIEIVDKPIENPTIPSTTISSSAIPSEPKVESSVKESASVNSHFDKQDIPNTVPLGSDTIEEDAQKALPEKMELISSKLKTDSGFEESSLPLDDGCSKDTNKETLLINSPVKNDDLPVEPKLSASVDSQLESNVEESFVQPIEIIDKTVETPTIASTTISSSAIPIEPKDESSVKQSACINSHFDINVQVTNETIFQSSEVPTVLSTAVVSSVIPSELKVNSNSDTNVQVTSETIVEEDAQMALSEKPELNSSKVKTDTGSEESSVPSDEGCSIDLNNETFPISSHVKNDDLPVETKLSPFVDSQLDSNVEDSIVQVANKIIDKPIENPTIASTTISSSAIPIEPKDESSVKQSASVNSHFDKQDIPNIVPQAGGDTAEEDTQNALSEKPELISSEAKAESGYEDDGCTIDANKETLPLNSPVKNDDLFVEPKPSASVNSQLESNVEKSFVQVANEIIDKPIENPTIPSSTITSSAIPSEPEVEFSVKESVSVNSNSDTNVQLTSETIVGSIEVPAVLSTTVISSVIPSEPKINSNSDINVEKNAVQNEDGIIADVHTDSSEVPVFLTSAIANSVILSKSKVNSNSNTDVQETNETIVEPIEVPAVLSTTVVSSVIPSGPKVDLNSDIIEERIAVQNEDGIKDDVLTDSMVEIINVEKNGITSVSVESHVAVNCKETCADVILETGKRVDNDSIQLSGEKEGSCEK